MAEQGLNAALCYENPDPKNYISMVPTSAHTGEGIGNLMALLVNLSQTLLAKRLAFSEELQVGVLCKRRNFGIPSPTSQTQDPIEIVTLLTIILGNGIRSQSNSRIGYNN